jgi:hypothetical protein
MTDMSLWVPFRIYRSAAGGWVIALRWRDGWQQWRAWYFERIH